MSNKEDKHKNDPTAQGLNTDMNGEISDEMMADADGGLTAGQWKDAVGYLVLGEKYAALKDK